VWQAGAGLTGDGASVYFNSGNDLIMSATSPSSYPATPRDQENSVIQLSVADGGTAPANVASFADTRPYHSDGNVFQYTNYNDYDMSSSAVVWIPGTDDLVTGSKGGLVYLIDRTNMTSRQTPLSPFTATPLPADQTLHIGSDSDGPEILGAPAVWRRTTDGNDDALVYMWPKSDRLTSFHYDHATSTMTVANATDLADTSGGMLSLSMNGTDASSAVLWATVGTGVDLYLRAYDPTKLTVLWQSALESNASYPGNAHYVAPTVSAGRVFAVSWPPSGGSDVQMFGTATCP
jgi:hypothetical protein